MHKLLGIMDEDPFDYKTWSGSSKYFFETLDEKKVLAAAISATPSKVQQRLQQLKSFHFNMEKWKFAYHLNTDLFKAMTNAAKTEISTCNIEHDSIVQVGAWYDLVSPNVINTSYHDGNLATLLSSPFGYPSISKSLIDKALEYERDLYSRLDLVFPMSQWLGDSFVKDFGVNENKVIPVGAGINLPKLKKTEGRNYSNKRLLMVGKDFERKGGKILLDAFKIVRQVIPEAELRIIGPMLENMPDGVHCLGFVSKHDPVGLDLLLDEYSQARVFVIPSLYEPFGISFVEAMAHRVPCVGTNICAMPEIIQDGVTGFVVPPNDSELLAERLIELLSSEELCKSMGNAGFERYEKNYTWEIVTSKILDGIGSLR